MSHYQKFIASLAGDINPAGVEASMRTHYGTLNHLGEEDFRDEIELAKKCEAASPGFLKMVAESYGLGADYQRWESVVA